MADYSNEKSRLALGEIDPQLDQLVKSGKLPPKSDWKNLDELRAARTQMEDDRLPSAEEAKHESVQSIKMRDGHEMEIRIHKPASAPAKSPLIVLIFGGGFVVGSNLQLSPYSRVLAKVYGATVVNLGYRLAPEHKFPAAPNDVWDSLVWLAANAASIGADPSTGFILGGVSAGGNLTAVTAQKALRESLSPALTGIWLSVPVLFTDDTVPTEHKPLFLSRQQNANAPVFNTKDVEKLNDYLSFDANSVDWSPFNDPKAHSGLPPAYFQVCGLDPLRDDGLIYEAVLREHGVKTRLDVYPGVPHAHFAFLPMLDSATKANADVIKGIGWLLGAEVNTANVDTAMAPGGA